MSILTKLLSGGAAKLVESVGGVIDNLHTSKEEKLVVFIDAGVIAFEVKASWVDLLQLVLITVIGAYFGGRSIEKVKK